MSTKHLKRSVLPCCIEVVSLFVWLWKPIHSQPPARTGGLTGSVSAPQSQTNRAPVPKQTSKQETLRQFQKSSFYCTIIGNNLFRPLGWRPPRPIEPYRLLGTRIPIDGNTVPQAVIQATATNTTHIVTIEEKLDTDTTVTDIQPKQGTFERTGKQQTLTLNTAPWLE